MPVTVYDASADWYADIVRRRALIHLQIIPEIMALAGDVAGRTILDIGCGEGVFTRELTDRGATVTGVDLSAKLLDLARARSASHDITWLHDDARTLARVPDDTFDGATCVMALMDIDALDAVLRSATRVVRPGGWLVVVLTHPCFSTPESVASTVDGRKLHATSRYLTEGAWRGNADGVRSRMGAQHRTLSTYLNAAIDSGWRLERMLEPPVVPVDPDPGEAPNDIPGLLLVRLTNGC